LRLFLVLQKVLALFLFRYYINTTAARRYSNQKERKMQDKNLSHTLAAIADNEFDGQRWGAPDREYELRLAKQVLHSFAEAAITAALQQTVDAIKVALSLASGRKITQRQDAFDLYRDECFDREAGVFLFAREEQETQVQSMIEVLVGLEDFYAAHHTNAEDVHRLVYLALKLDAPARGVFRSGLVQHALETDTTVYA